MLAELEPIASSLAENRRMLAEILAGLTEQDLGVSPAEGEYSGREVLAHLAGAERGMLRLAQLMAQGQQPRLKPDYDNDYYNQRQQEKRAAMSVSVLRAELEQVRVELLAFMSTLQAPDLERRGEHPLEGDSTVRQVLEIIASHEKSHVEEYGEWVREWKGLPA